MLHQTVVAVLLLFPSTCCLFAQTARSLPPELLSPKSEEMLDNGCQDRKDDLIWTFEWAKVPQARRYHLYVMGRNAQVPVIDDDNIKSNSYKDSRKGYIAEPYRWGWRWKVRALVNGEWTGWSEERVFNVEPLDEDCRKGLSAKPQSATGTKPNEGTPTETVDSFRLVYRPAPSTPEITRRVMPPYTSEARAHGTKGIVQLSALFTADGRITNIRVVQGLPHGLTEESIIALSMIRFNPALKDGKPVSVRMSSWVYNFTLQNSGPITPTGNGLQVWRQNHGVRLYRVGDVYAQTGEKQIALDYYNQALSVFREVKDRDSEAKTLLAMGAAHSDLGDYQNALKTYNQALLLKRGVMVPNWEAIMFTTIGSAYTALGEQQKALAHLNQALPLWQANKDIVGQARTLHNLGIVYSDLGDRQQALKYYNDALSLRRAIKDQGGEASTLNNLGRVYSDLGDLQNALKYLNDALALHRTVGNRVGQAAVLNNLGRIYDTLGEKPNALTAYTQALSLYEAEGDRRGEATIFNNFGGVYFALGEKQKATDYFNQALRLRRATKERTGEAGTLGNLMRLWNDQQFPYLAVYYGKQSINHYQELRADISGLDKELQRTFLKSKESTYRELADILIGLGRLPEAQQVLDLLKEEEYFDYIRRDNNEAAGLKGRATLTPTEARLEKEYANIADLVTALGKELDDLNQLADPTAAQIARRIDLDQKLKLATTRFQAFLGRLEKELGNSAQAGERMTQVKSAEGFQDTLRELGAGTVALYTIVGEKKYSVILITPQSQVAGEYPISRVELHKKIYALKDALKSPTSNLATLQTQAAELYKILIGPIAKNLDGAQAETLMWSLDGALRYLPMGVLFDAQRQQYLLERYRTVVYTPAGASDLKNQPRPNWQGAGFGVSKAVSNAEVGTFKALSGVPGELRSVIRTADNKDGVIEGAMYLDERFTEESFREALRTRQYPLIHVASHFAFRPGDSLKSFLLLGNGKALTLEEIRRSQNLFGGVDLLALSACETGVGEKDEEGREVEGFGALAQNKGAKAVLATLWPVADESTAKLMAEFYWLREAKAVNKAEALRQAQVQLLRGTAAGTGESAGRGVKAATTGQPSAPSDASKPYAHPYYWAPFILIGNWK